MSTPAKQKHHREKKIWGFPPNIFFMGWASLFTDISTEMINSVLPFFLSNVIGASKTTIGIIEGIAESTASILKFLSGWLSDIFKQRKPWIVGGYLLSVIAKSFLPLASTSASVFAFRFFDRFGKGIRSAPRDAFIADSSPVSIRGKSFGFHKAMDTLGAAIGPLLAFLVLAFIDKDGYRIIFWVALIPALISVWILIFYVQEKRKEQKKEEPAPLLNTPPSPQPGDKPKISLKDFDISFFILLAIVVIYTLGTPSDAFLLLRAEDVGIPLPLIPLAYLTSNLLFSIIAFPAGIVSDRIGRIWMILGGYIIFSLVFLGFAHVSDRWMIFVLFAFYGIHLGMTEGVMKAFIADIVPAESRGTAYGIYYTAVGLTLLPASIIAGLLWQYHGAAAPFYFGFATSLIAITFLILWLFGSNISKVGKLRESQPTKD